MNETNEIPSPEEAATEIHGEWPEIDLDVFVGQLPQEFERLKGLTNTGHELVTEITDTEGRNIVLTKDSFEIEEIETAEDDSDAKHHRLLTLKEKFHDPKTGKAVAATVVAVGAIFTASKVIRQRRKS